MSKKLETTTILTSLLAGCFLGAVLVMVVRSLSGKEIWPFEIPDVSLFGGFSLFVIAMVGMVVLVLESLNEISFLVEIFKQRRKLYKARDSAGNEGKGVIAIIQPDVDNFKIGIGNSSYPTSDEVFSIFDVNRGEVLKIFLYLNGVNILECVLNGMNLKAGEAMVVWADWEGKEDPVYFFSETWSNGTINVSRVS